jgi:hypothetical protein
MRDFIALYRKHITLEMVMNMSPRAASESSTQPDVATSKPKIAR